MKDRCNYFHTAYIDIWITHFYQILQSWGFQNYINYVCHKEKKLFVIFKVGQTLRFYDTNMETFSFYGCLKLLSNLIIWISDTYLGECGCIFTTSAGWIIPSIREQ